MPSSVRRIAVLQGLLLLLGAGPLAAQDVPFDRDPFAGVDRRFEECVGLGWSILTGPTNLVDLEAGAGMNQQRSETT